MFMVGPLVCVRVIYNSWKAALHLNVMAATSTRRANGRGRGTKKASGCGLETANWAVTIGGARPPGALRGKQGAVHHPRFCRLLCRNAVMVGLAFPNLVRAVASCAASRLQVRRMEARQAWAPSGSMLMSSLAASIESTCQ